MLQIDESNEETVGVSKCSLATGRQLTRILQTFFVMLYPILISTMSKVI